MNSTKKEIASALNVAELEIRSLKSQLNMSNKALQKSVERPQSIAKGLMADLIERSKSGLLGIASQTSVDDQIALLKKLFVV